MTTLSRRCLGSLVVGMLGQSQMLGQAKATSLKSLPLPISKPTLTISGNITQVNSGDKAILDRPTLEGIGQAGFETKTPWYNGAMRFDGVPMSQLMDAVGASGTVLRVTALNDYTTDIPMADLEQFKVLLATKRNAEYMPVRDKGPFFIIYPFDDFPELQNHKYYSRSAWQVASLNIA